MQYLSEILSSCPQLLSKETQRGNAEVCRIVKKLLDILTSMERVNKAFMDKAKVETRSLLEEFQVTKRNSGDKDFKWNAQHDPAEILGIIV